MRVDQHTQSGAPGCLQSDRRCWHGTLLFAVEWVTWFWTAHTTPRTKSSSHMHTDTAETAQQRAAGKPSNKLGFVCLSLVFVFSFASRYTLGIAALNVRPEYVLVGIGLIVLVLSGHLPLFPPRGRIFLSGWLLVGLLSSLRASIRFRRSQEFPADPRRCVDLDVRRLSWAALTAGCGEYLPEYLVRGDLGRSPRNRLRRIGSDQPVLRILFRSDHAAQNLRHLLGTPTSTGSPQ